MVTPLKSEKEILIPPKKQLLGRKEKENPNPLLLKALSKKGKNEIPNPFPDFSVDFLTTLSHPTSTTIFIKKNLHLDLQLYPLIPFFILFPLYLKMRRLYILGLSKALIFIYFMYQSKMPITLKKIQLPTNMYDTCA
jgi:hypothetical protein